MKRQRKEEERRKGGSCSVAGPGKSDDTRNGY